MPTRHIVVHLIDKKPDGQPAILHARDAELPDSEAIENLLADLNYSYNAKPNKAWGLFHEESGAYPFSGWLHAYLEGKQPVVEPEPHRVRVEVPVQVPCRVKAPAVPAWAAEGRRRGCARRTAWRCRSGRCWPSPDSESAMREF